MLGPNYWNGDTRFLFSVGFQVPMSNRCSPATSFYSPSSNNVTFKLYLIPRSGRAQRMEMLPALRESSPSSKFLLVQDSTIGGRTHAHGMVGSLPCSFIAKQCSVPASFNFMMLFIAKAAPRAADEVMTLSPRDTGTCSHLHD
jgi:hypothetical protein